MAPPHDLGRQLLSAAGWLLARPWLLVVAAALLLGGVALHNLMVGWRHRRHCAGARVVTVAPPPEVDPHGAAAFWANLAGILTPSRTRRLRYGSPHAVWQYT